MNFTFTQAKRFRRDSSGEDDVEEEDSCEEELTGDSESLRDLEVIPTSYIQDCSQELSRSPSPARRRGAESRSRWSSSGVSCGATRPSPSGRRVS